MSQALLYRGFAERLAGRPAKSSAAGRRAGALCLCLASLASASGAWGAGSARAAPLQICELARSARERGSALAARLETECAAQGGSAGTPSVEAETVEELAALGQILVLSDPRAWTLRNLQPEAARRGFDVGMATAEADTAGGPGKQKLQRSLVAAEQEGFKAAVSYCLDRNRNSEYAAIGARAAGLDPGVARVRKGHSDPRYWLGADIATGLFGDRRWGAQGNTAWGPGSMAIRDSLGTLARQGFEAAVRYHLERKY